MAQTLQFFICVKDLNFKTKLEVLMRKIITIICALSMSWTSYADVKTVVAQNNKILIKTNIHDGQEWRSFQFCNSTDNCQPLGKASEYPVSWLRVLMIEPFNLLALGFKKLVFTINREICELVPVSKSQLRAADSRVYKSSTDNFSYPNSIRRNFSENRVLFRL